MKALCGRVTEPFVSIEEVSKDDESSHSSAEPSDSRPPGPSGQSETENLSHLSSLSSSSSMSGVDSPDGAVAGRLSGNVPFGSVPLKAGEVGGWRGTSLRLFKTRLAVIL